MSSQIPPLPFDHFWSYAEVTTFCQALATAQPGLVTLSSLGDSREGRAIHLLTITDLATGPAADKPAYLIHGNIHALELSGTHSALYTARQLVADAAARDLLGRVAFHIVPRINPDGAEFAVRTSGRIRSRTDRSQLLPNTLYQEDVNGDGLILSVRQEHPDGSFVCDPEEPRLLIRRRAEHVGPFYRVLPEGLIHDWDGTERIEIEGRRFDWNRNWSYDWRPEPEQPGAGDFAFSEPEMRALAEFMHGHANLFGVLGYHTGPAAVLTPPSTGSATDIDESDWQTMQELARIAAAETGIPIRPVVNYHGDDNRDINLRGHFHNFGYHHLGLYVYEFELGILENSAGISTEEMFAAKSQAEWDALSRRMLRWWDEQEERDPIYAPWTRFEHPQLGDVEIGGLLNRHLAGRTLPDLERIAEGTYRFTLQHAGRHPHARLEEPEVREVAPNLWRIRVRAANRGDFPTNVTNKGKTLRGRQAPRIEFHPATGMELVSYQGHRALGHLDGVSDSRILEWFVRGSSDTGDLAEITLFGGAGGNHRLTVRR